MIKLSDTKFRNLRSALIRVLQFIVLIPVLFACNDTQQHSGASEIVLQLNENGKFKIAQITDVHLHNNDKEEVRKTREAILNVHETEQPDLYVLTGDIVNAPSDEGWKTIVDIFSSFETPWTVTLGNHDDEDVWSREEIFDFLMQQPGFAGQKGPDISGVGNYIIPLVSNKDQQNKALLYFFDSHGYPDNPERGSYDWIKFDQINWYREKSTQFTEENNGKPYPALAFFHIPLPEYELVEESTTAVGTHRDGSGAPDINSGMLASFVEMQDVMGTFTGHDHLNNYVFIHNDVALAYGQISGYGGYGDFSRGARIIEITEDEYAFNTWIRTLEEEDFHYNYPFGDSFKAENMSYMTAVEAPDNLIPGLSYVYYEGKFKSVSEFTDSQKIKNGVNNNLTLDMAEKEDFFGLEFTGFIEIPYTGLYNFYSFSDDGSQIFIGDTLVVDNDGSHSLRRVNGKIALEKGYHPIRVLYFEDYMGEKLEAGISGLKIRETTLPDDMLFTVEKK